MHSTHSGRESDTALQVALVQYPDPHTAGVAKQALDGHPMYDGGHNVVSDQSLHMSLLSHLAAGALDFSLCDSTAWAVHSMKGPLAMGVVGIIAL